VLTTELYPYQKPALEQYLERGNLLLAWEMGLGKTLLAIAAAEKLAIPCLIIAPASLMVQWAVAIARHTDLPTYEKKIKGETFVLPVEEYCQIIDGTVKQRKAQFYNAYANLPRYTIVSYGTVVSSPRWIRKLKAQMVVVDEASNIKSFGAARTKAVKRLRPAYRLALTGTPVENRPDEAFSIMQWVDDTVLGDWDLFEATFIERDAYDNVKCHKNLGLFHKKMLDAMNRKGRTDEDVAPYLPEADIREWYVDIDNHSVEAYRKIAGDLSTAIAGLRGQGGQDLGAYYAGTSRPDETTQLGRVMSRQLALELLLDHPDLVINSALDYQESLWQQEQGIERANWKGSKYCYDVWQEGVLDDARESAKLHRLVREVRAILDNPAARILVFSRFKYMLSILEDALGVPCVQYHGDMDSGAKAAAVRSFTDSDHLRVFLSSHAGAYGTDMYMANWLINYDLPWSAGKADQINGRHQRAASEFDLVYVRNMITSGTVEERKLDMLDYKRSLSAAVIDGRVGVSGRIVNDLDSLSSWLEDFV
jgi:SNF2 family DNA or RNA helicase